MTLDDLRALAREFFECPENSDGRTVSTISALLFAQHVLQLREKSLDAQNSASTPTLRDAAQQALEALDAYSWEQVDAARTALRAALEQQAEPEPVAWMCPDDPERETAFHWQAGHCDNCGKQRIPLYAAPPQRKPLTDAEIEKLFGGAVADVPRAHWLRQAAIEVVRKTERAHGIGEEV